MPVPRDLQHAQHLQRLGVEITPGRRQQLAVRQHEALLQQGGVGLFLQRGWAQRGAHDRRLQHGGDARHLPRGQEVMAHEALHPVLPSVARVAHAGADHRLQVEGQPVLRTAGDRVEVAAHRPQEVPGPPGVLGLALHQDAAAGAFGTDQLAHDLGAEDVAAHPVQAVSNSR